MFYRLLRPIALASPLLAAAALAHPANRIATFAGHWRVAAVTVPTTGVQALAEDDPSLLGKGLTISAARLAWDRMPVTRDACAAPSIMRRPTPAPAELRARLRRMGVMRPATFAIRCRSGSWGPSQIPMLYRGADGTLAMPWYDNGLLKLVRR